MSHWLVTGGAGFIGSHLTESLVKKNQKVRVIDNLSTGNLKNIQPVLSKIELIRGDIRSSQSLRRAMKGIDYVLHEAALRSVVRSLEAPAESNSVNVAGTLNVLLEARRAKVKRVVYASSSSVYGDSKSFPQSPEARPQPISPYAVSKLAGENYCQVFAKTMGLSTVSLRYFNVFGPRQDARSKYAAVIPIFMQAAAQGRPIPIDGDGRQSRDFAYIENIVEANIAAARTPAASGQVLNVACGETNSLLEYVDLLEKLTGHKLQRIFLKARAGDVRKTEADISKTIKFLGYRRRVNFEEGIRRTWYYFSNNSSRGAKR